MKSAIKIAALAVLLAALAGGAGLDAARGQDLPRWSGERPPAAEPPVSETPAAGAPKPGEREQGAKTVTASDSYYEALRQALRKIDRVNNHAVAICGSRVVTSYDMETEAALRTVRLSGFGAWREGNEALSRPKLLQVIINQLLVTQEAEQFRDQQSGPLRVERAELSRALDGFWAAFPDEAAKAEFLSRTGIDTLTIASIFIREIVVDRYIEEKLSKTLTISNFRVMIEMARNRDKYKNSDEARLAVRKKEMERQAKALIENLRKKTDIRYFEAGLLPR